VRHLACVVDLVNQTSRLNAACGRRVASSNLFGPCEVHSDATIARGIQKLAYSSIKKRAPHLRLALLSTRPPPTSASPMPLEESVFSQTPGGSRFLHATPSRQYLCEPQSGIVRAPFSLSDAPTLRPLVLPGWRTAAQIASVGRKLSTRSWNGPIISSIPPKRTLSSPPEDSTSC